MGLNLKALIGKLNEPARLALEGAAGLCLSRTNYDVEVEHYLNYARTEQALFDRVVTCYERERFFERG